MKIEAKTEIKNIDWSFTFQTLKSVGMAHYSAEKHRKAFEASYCTVFLYDQDKMVGFGRAISDGSYQAAIYDCAVIYQSRLFGNILTLPNRILFHILC